MAGAAGTLGGAAGAYGQAIVEKVIPSAPVWVYVAGAAVFGIPAVWEKVKQVRDKVRGRGEDRPDS